MNKYDKYLNEIIEEIFDEKQYLEKNIFNEVGKILKETCIGKKFAIWGSGDHTTQLYKYFSSEIKDAEFILDNDKSKEGKKFLKFDIRYPDVEKIKLIDVILISSFSCVEQIEEQIKKMDVEVEVINIYDKLEKKGVKLQAAFYSDASIYTDIYKLKKAFNEKKQENILKDIILNYLKIRDINNAKKYINIYINNNYDKYNKMIELLRRLEYIENDIIDRINEKAKDNIFIFYWDALRYKDVHSKNTQMKYINSILNQSTYFTNTYSPSIFTYDSVQTILTGLDKNNAEIKDKKIVSDEHCEFIKEAQSKGYKIKIYTNYWDIIEGEKIEHFNSDYATLTIWNAVCNMAASSDSKNIYILYFWQETHPPHFCGNHEKIPFEHSTPFSGSKCTMQSQEDYNNQYNECLRYIDEVMEYYYSILGENTLKILFSDHGQIIEQATYELKDIGTLAGWHDDRVHIPLVITGGHISKKRIDGLFSMSKFNEIMKLILDKKQISLDIEDKIYFRFSKMYNAIMVNNYKKAKMEDYVHGFIVYMNDKYKCVITGNNKIRYFYKSNDNEIFDKKEIENIKSLFEEEINMKHIF